MIRLRKALVVFWSLFFTMVLSMGVARHVLEGGRKITGCAKETVFFLMELPSNLSQLLNPHVLQPLEKFNAHSLGNGFTYAQAGADQSGYLLVSAWDDDVAQGVVKLVRIRDGRILHRWVPDIDAVLRVANSALNKKVYAEAKLKYVKSNTLLIHPLLLNDGSLIFQVGAIFKIDRNGHIVWIHQAMCHHSLELDAEGMLWVCSFNDSGRNADKYQMTDDVIAKLSPDDGCLLYKKSVFELLMENGYSRGEFFISPSSDRMQSYLDYIHLNDIQPVFEDAPYWKKGDVFLSLRNQNMVLLYRPSTNRVLWRQNGPWLRQHDVCIIDSTKIGVFGNNVIESYFEDADDAFVDGQNEQYVYDFAKNEITTPYRHLFASLAIKTRTQGRSRILPDGSIFVEDTNEGRSFLGDYEKAVWTFAEGIDKRRLRVTGWNRYLTEEEFSKLAFIQNREDGP
jgi:hypothetical protein